MASNKQKEAVVECIAKYLMQSRELLVSRGFSEEEVDGLIKEAVSLERAKPESMCVN